MSTVKWLWWSTQTTTLLISKSHLKNIVQWIASCKFSYLARSHGPITYTMTSWPADLIGPRDLASWTYSVKQPAIHCINYHFAKLTPDHNTCLNCGFSLAKVVKFWEKPSQHYKGYFMYMHTWWGPTGCGEKKPLWRGHWSTFRSTGKKHLLEESTTKMPHQVPLQCPSGEIFKPSGEIFKHLHPIDPLAL